MTFLEPCCARCDTQGCFTAVCLDAHPEALCDRCGEVTCLGCWHDCGRAA